MGTLRAQFVGGLWCLLSVGTIAVSAGSVFAENRPETGSVIPIGEKSQEQVGSPILIKTLEAGTSSRRVRRIAVSEFPLHLMEPQSQANAQHILNNLSLYRRLPVIELESDRRCYEFFTNHPDVAVSIWRAMNISNVQMKRESETRFETDTQDGTLGTVHVLLNTPEHYVVTCHGEFKSPAIKKSVQAMAMMHLKPTFRENGTIVHQLDLYVSFPSNAIEAIARLISPVSNRIADRNFEEISLFVEMMSMAMSHQPGWVEKIAQDLDGVRPGDADKLLALTATLYVETARKERIASGMETQVSDILPPVETKIAIEMPPVVPR
ncbi:hypothetical protein [Thalassoglobus sp.]|uniref:hypothetical protein n=1 Tax=Thalassoglobus sp. TaxID=2795869 RepID=UPI003AA842C5